MSFGTTILTRRTEKQTLCEFFSFLFFFGGGGGATTYIMADVQMVTIQNKRYSPQFRPVN